MANDCGNVQHLYPANEWRQIGGSRDFGIHFSLASDTMVSGQSWQKLKSETSKEIPVITLDWIVIGELLL